MKTIRMFALSAGCMMAVTCGAKVVLPQFYTDNMVVQQKSVLKVPGTAKPGSTVTMTTDWGSEPVKAKADKNGRFLLEMATPAAGGPYTMIFSDGTGDDTVLCNVLSGEVWICSGQSNMEFPVNGWGALMNKDEVVATAVHPDIRLLQIKKNRSLKPLEDAEVNMGGWVETSPAVMDFSAVAYLYGLELHRELGVPIGVIDTSWGGTVAEAWTSFDYLKGIEGFETDLDEIVKADFSRENLQAGYESRVNEWNKLVEGLDVEFDRAKMQTGAQWGKMPVPEYWEKTVLHDFDGMVWVQREFELPASAAGKPLELHLGVIDDNDLTFFNGDLVGATDSWMAPRVYKVPGKDVKAGKNVISIRIIDLAGGGGIYGAPGSVCAIVDGVTYPLAGDWNYMIAGDIRSLPHKPEPVDSPNYPTGLYNAMLYPLHTMPVAGAIWYQGCSNVGRDQQYEKLFQSMIKDWRHLWGEDMPFYFVQLAGFQTPRNLQPESAWAALRNSQAKALNLPNTGMAVAIDLGHPGDIHPVNKQEVARRLSLLALNRTYGHGCVDEGPRCIDSKIDGNKMVLKFNGELKPTSSALTGFIIGDKNGKFAYANAKLVGNDTVVLSSPLIAAPTVVRYDWADYPGGNLYGPTGLPVAPFATDL